MTASTTDRGDTFVKLFDLDGYQVVLIDRGVSDTPGCTDFEIVTRAGAVDATFKLPIPERKAEQFWSDFDRERAALAVAGFRAEITGRVSA